MARSLFRASILVSLALLLSRLSGLIREQVLGARLGLSADMDGALLILTLPDLMVGLLLSGGFTAALVPALTRADPGDRATLMRRVMTITGLGAMAFSVGLFVATPLVLAVLAPSLDMAKLTAFQIGFGLSLAAIPISAAIGVSSSYLQVAGRYSIPALTVLAFNGVLVLYFLVAISGPPVNFAIFGAIVVLAAALRFALQVARMPDAFRRTPPDKSAPRFGPDFASSFVKGILGAAVIVGMPLVFRSLYALGGDGELARFNYALRLFELPMGILIAPLTVIFLPLLSKLHRSDPDTFLARTGLALRAAFLLGLAATITVVVFARPIAGLLFGFGEMRGEGVEAIASAIRILILGLPFMAAFQILSGAQNASDRTGPVLRQSCIAFALSFGLALLLIQWPVPPSLAAEIGFVAFCLVAALLGFRAVFTRHDMGTILALLGGITLRAALVALPFLFLIDRQAELPPRPIELLLLIALPLAILTANYRVLRELAQIRDTRAETH